MFSVVKISIFFRKVLVKFSKLFTESAVSCLSDLSLTINIILDITINSMYFLSLWKQTFFIVKLKFMFDKNYFENKFPNVEYLIITCTEI